MIQRTTRLLLGNAAAAFDRAVNVTAIARPDRRSARPRTHQVNLEWVRILADQYRAAGAYESFFTEPRTIEPVQHVRAEKAGRLRVIDLQWPSDYSPFLPNLSASYRFHPANQLAAARLVVDPERPRPLAVMIHGYLGGVHRLERRVWPLEFFQRIGMDVALFVLPFHGSRAGPRAFGEVPPFPGSDPRVTNEGFRQAIGDLRDLIHWLFDRGHQQIGVMGMSLGGFTTALAATVEPKLAFAIPLIPLVSIADMARRQGRLGTTSRQADALFEALEPIYRLTSPLHRPAVIRPSSILVIGGEQDQITPIAHARMLATHFGCRIETWPGGHLIQLGRAEKFRSVGRFLNELGVIRRP